MYLRLEQDIVTPQFLQAIKAAIKIASELPGDRQNELAQLLLEEITDWEWESTPEFRTAIEKSRAECAEGDSMDFEEFVKQWQTEG
ncbi:MAG TPA: hypothetical protein VN207_02515 [Ktedonobacteraceae bacterium]|nr:hypothetical protein [Ktedonobacteraceae bacterium]